MRMRQYADFVSRNFRRRFMTRMELLSDPRIADSQRRELPYPRERPPVDMFSMPRIKRIYRRVTLD